MKYGTAYFGGEEGLRETYVSYAREVLESHRLKSTGELETELNNQKKIIETLLSQIKNLEGQVTEQSKVIGEAIAEFKAGQEAYREISVEFEAEKEFYDEIKEFYKEMKEYFEELRRA